MSQLPKRLTPLQEALKECNRLASDVAQTREELHRLRDMQEKIISLLPSEQQLLNEAWDAGGESYKQYVKHNESGAAFTCPDKIQYLSQFNKEK